MNNTLAPDLSDLFLITLAPIFYGAGCLRPVGAMKRTLSTEADAAARELRQNGCAPAVLHLPNPYGVLGVPLGAEFAEVRQAFLRSVRAYPPDRAPSEFLCVVEAYQMLKDPQRRQALEDHLIGVSAEGGKRRRCEERLTQRAAAAFFQARDATPVLALDQQGHCHGEAMQQQRKVLEESEATLGPEVTDRATEIAASSTDCGVREMRAPIAPRPAACALSPACQSNSMPLGGVASTPVQQNLGVRYAETQSNSSGAGLGRIGQVKRPIEPDDDMGEPLMRTDSVASAMSVS